MPVGPTHPARTWLLWVAGALMVAAGVCWIVAWHGLSTSEAEAHKSRQRQRWTAALLTAQDIELQSILDDVAKACTAPEVCEAAAAPGPAGARVAATVAAMQQVSAGPVASGRRGSSWALGAAAALCTLAWVLVWVTVRTAIGSVDESDRGGWTPERVGSEPALLASVLQHFPGGVHIFTVDGAPVLSSSNPARRRGFSEVDFVAQGVVDIRDHPMLAALDAGDAFEQARQGQHAALPARTIRLPRADGSGDGPLTIEVQMVPVSADGSRTTHVAALTRDVTDAVALEAKVRRAERLAALGRLAAGVAHEVNNPLMVVQVNQQLVGRLIEDVAPTAAADARLLLDPISAAVARIQLVTSDLSELARPPEEDAHLVDLATILEEVVALAGAPKSVAVVVETNARPKAWGTELRLHQVFSNLVQNAVRATQDTGGTVTVRLGMSVGDYAEVAVVDTGVGMSPEVRQQIFEPFFTTRRGGVGSGLGMYLVKLYLDELGGHIHVDSALGQGTTMRVHFPPVDKASAPVDLGEALPSGVRMLVVDPLGRTGPWLRSILPEVGVIQPVCSAAEARLRYRENNHWDVVFIESVPGEDTGPTAEQLGPLTRRLVRVAPSSDRPTVVAAVRGVLGR